jgi:DNA-directed RNA polymerase alpha subunit
VAYAARILQDQLSIFVNFEEPEAAGRAEDEDDLEFNPPSSRRWTSWNCPCVRPTA